MAGRSLLFGGASNGSSSMAPSYSTSSQQPLGSFFMPAPSSFLGSRSMVSFKDVNGANRSEKSFFRSFDQDEIGDEDLEEYFHQPEKKRRLTSEQVQFLERSFEAENKLEPERKVQLAKDLGLQPRQIAIWFQNRRARWKTKNLEKEYETLKASYDSLKADYDNLLNEKEKLKAEALHLTDKLLLKDKEKDSSFCASKIHLEASPKEPVADSDPANEISKASAMALMQEHLSSAKSDVFDSDSPHYTDEVHSSFLEPGDSSYVFEPEQSDLSQDEDDNLSKNLFPPAYVFPKIEYADFPGPPANSSYFGFPLEDHAFNFWSC